MRTLMTQTLDGCESLIINFRFLPYTNDATHVFRVRKHFSFARALSGYFPFVLALLSVCHVNNFHSAVPFVVSNSSSVWFTITTICTRRVVMNDLRNINKTFASIVRSP